MAYVPVPKDLTKVKTKVAFNLTKRQLAQLEQQARSGQPISLMDLADAVHREDGDKRKSVVEQLHQQPKQESKKTAPKKSAEREL